MPLISEFFGIKIYMYWEEHTPPHFHAEYGGRTILVDIKEGVVLRGAFPFKQLKFVLAWCELHEEELMENWELATKHEKIQPIEPLR
jgi:hypothetical protein